MGNSEIAISCTALNSAAHVGKACRCFCLAVWHGDATSSGSYGFTSFFIFEGYLNTYREKAKRLNKNIMDTPTTELTKLLNALNLIHLALVAANEKLEALIEAETMQMAMAV